VSIEATSSSIRSSNSDKRSGRKRGTAYVLYYSLHKSRTLLVCQLIIQEEQQHRQEYIDNEIDKNKATRTEVSRGREGRHESLEGRVVSVEEEKIVVYCR